MLIAFHKPYGVVSQFTRENPSHRTLAEFGFPPGVYPIGRLDLDSEGLLLLTDEGELNQMLLNPKMLTIANTGFKQNGYQNRKNSFD